MVGEGAISTIFVIKPLMSILWSCMGERINAKIHMLPHAMWTKSILEDPNKDHRENKYQSSN